MGVSFLSRMIWFSYLERAGCHGRDLDRRAHLIRRGIRQREWHACINRVVQAAGGGREGVFGVNFARHLGTLRPAIQTIERQAHIPADGPNQRRREARDIEAAQMGRCTVEAYRISHFKANVEAQCAA